MTSLTEVVTGVLDIYFTFLYSTFLATNCQVQFYEEYDVFVLVRYL